MKYDFFSIGPKGVVWKAIKFNEIGVNRFNVAFGDWDESLDKIDDKVRSNNLDRDKLLNTVGFAVLEFLEKFPGVHVAAWGSTLARTRLYQMAIKANWLEINLWVNVYGHLNGAWQKMEKHKNYDAFIISDKNHILF